MYLASFADSMIEADSRKSWTVLCQCGEAFALTSRTKSTHTQRRHYPDCLKKTRIHLSAQNKEKVLAGPFKFRDEARIAAMKYNLSKLEEVV